MQIRNRSNPNHIRSIEKGRPASKRSRNVQKQNAVRATSYAPSDFLKQTFYPLYSKPAPAPAKREQIELNIQESASILCRQFNIPTPPDFNLPHPLNIWNTFLYCKKEVERKDDTIKLVIVEKENAVHLATVQMMENTYDLFYIPLYPLYNLLITAYKRDLADLLLSCFSYLYHAGVSIVDRGSYMLSEMQSTKEYLTDGEADWDDKVEFTQVMEYANQTIQQCKMLSKKIKSKINLKRFKDRLEKIESSSEAEKEVINAVQNIFLIAKEFPDRHFGQRLASTCKIPFEDSPIYCEQYLSFYWGDDSVFDNYVTDYIESALQEIAEIDYPVCFHVFDKSDNKYSPEFVFETRLLNAISQLNSALYELPC